MRVMMMTEQEILKIALRRNVKPATVKTWVRRYGDQGARDYEPMARSERGKLGKANSNWRKFRLPGSPYYGQ